MISNINSSYPPNINFGQKYRVILTMNCPRACKDCINTFAPVLKNAEHVKLADIVSKGDDIVLTGGEPAIYPNLGKVVEKLKSKEPDSKIFIYSATANQRLLDTIPKVDGLSFTLHDNASDVDINRFNKLQEKLQEIKENDPSKSYRLYIDGRLEKPVTIKPNLYSRVDIIKWMNEEEVMAKKDRNFGCPVDEKLVILDSID